MVGLNRIYVLVDVQQSLQDDLEMSGAAWQKYMKMPRQMGLPPRLSDYWKKLTVTERQSVLFLDEAELVKQLYKLNFSLLCVGLMQRRLKKNTEEPTYELLEAMEFMDIGTGIMTVKNELVQDDQIHTLFSLIQDSLQGFLVSPHVIGDKEFHQLFFQDSEGISSWNDYQNLIAILLEQLIIKSFVAYLEKESIRQMEALLQEVDLEAAKEIAKKSKKKKKRRKVEQENNCQNISPSQLDIPAPPSSPAEKQTTSQPSLSPVVKNNHKLNPSALEFKPLLPLKRKFDSFVVELDEDDRATREDSEDDVDIRDAELDEHLANIYQLTSELFGWDFEQQREYSAQSTWETPPHFFMTNSVVRYFNAHCPSCASGYCRRHYEWPSWQYDPPTVQGYQNPPCFRG